MAGELRLCFSWQCRAVFQSFLKSTWLVKSFYWLLWLCFSSLYSLSTEEPRCWQWAACVAAKWYFDEMTVSSLCSSVVRHSIVACGLCAPVGQADPWVYTAGSSSCQLRQRPITDVRAAAALAASSLLCWPYSRAQPATGGKWNDAAVSEPVKGMCWVYGRLDCWATWSEENRQNDPCVRSIAQFWHISICQVIVAKATDRCMTFFQRSC